MLSRFSRVRLFATLWTVAHQAPLSLGFFRQEYWSGLPCPPPGDLPNLETEPMFLMSPVLAGVLCTASATWEAQSVSCSDLSDSFRPHGLYSPPGLSVQGIVKARKTGVGSHSLLQGIFLTQGSSAKRKPRSSALQADALTSEPPGKPFWLLRGNNSFM